MIGNREHFSLHYDRESCSLKSVWDGEESTRVHKSPESEITSSFASWPVICVPDMRSGASSRQSGIASKARGCTNHRVHKSPSQCDCADLDGQEIEFCSILVSIPHVVSGRAIMKLSR